MTGYFLALLLGGARPAAAPDFAEVERRVLGPSCALSGCHDSPLSPMGLDLRPGKAWESLAGRPSQEVAMLGLPEDFALLVAPGRPDRSWLMVKLEGGPWLEGEKMPLDGPCLSEDDIKLVRRWIEAGALPPAPVRRPLR